MLDYPEYTLGIQARYGEAGTDGKIRLGALANWFQEAAGHNASALGFGDERLFAEGKAWILTRMAFRIKELPSPGDKVNIRTWPAKLEHLGHRGYEVYNASDELIVAAVSAWTVLDLSTRRLTALPEELAAVYPVNTIPCIPFPYHPTVARGDRQRRRAGTARRPRHQRTCQQLKVPWVVA